MESQVRYFSVPSDRTRGNEHKVITQEELSEHQKTLFYCEDDWPLEQVAQRFGGVSHPGDTQKASGHSPKQLALCGPAW